jgi:hypothetical protein
VEAALAAFLAADVTLKPLHGGRVFKGIPRRRAAYPQVTLTRVSTLYGLDLTATDPAPGVRLQLDCWAVREGDERTLADAVTDVLAGYRGLMGTRQVQCVVPKNDFDSTRIGAEAGGDKGAADLYRATLEVVVWPEP